MNKNQTIQLIQLSLKGDQLAQHQLFHLYVAAMYNTVLRLVENEMEAQDIVQEGFIKAFGRLDQFRYRSTFGAWLKRIMINCALDRLRKNLPQHLAIDRIADLEEGEGNDPLMPSPEVVNQEILKLPQGCRQVLSLYLIEGYDQKEIAKDLGISLSTVKSQYRRAKLLLRERLTQLKHE